MNSSWTTFLGLALAASCGGSTTHAILESAPDGGPVGTTGVTVGTAGNAGSTGGSGGPGGSGTAGSTVVTTGGGAGGSDSSGGAGGSAGGVGGSASGGTAGVGTAGGGGAAGAGKGGSGGSSAGAGGAGGTPTIDDLAGTKNNFGFAWKDSWFILPCYTKEMADCFTVPVGCPGTPAGGGFEDSGSVDKEVFALGGTLGTTYRVSFNFNGISSAKNYQGGNFANPSSDLAVPMAGDPPALAEGATFNDTFYIGGTAVPTTFNVLRMRVLGPLPQRAEVARYYMNAFPAGAGWESHRAFAISYSHTIEVPAQGEVEFVAQDGNCRAIDNCGPGAVPDNSCPAPRYIPNEPMNLQLPPSYSGKPLASLNVVNGAMQPWHAQISHFTITKVAVKP